MCERLQVAEGSRVWIAASADNADEPFALCAVTALSPLTVRPVGGGAEFEPADGAVSLVNHAMERDNTNLQMLSEATLLANTRDMYLTDAIYTTTGRIVTSVNPCKRCAVA